MVQFHTFGSTSKYCFICAAPCFIPPASERQGELTLRDRRHLCNTRILGWQGISHPGLTWHYDEQQNAMVCLGYACQIYRQFDPSRQDCCLAVHRSCYTLLSDHVERTGSSASSNSLLQRMLPYIDNNGVIDTSRIRHRHWQQQSTGAKAQPWMMCDPTDLPSIPPLDINTTAEAQISVLIGQLEGDEMAGLYKSELGHINLQLHTPPDSPTESIKDTRTFGDFNDNSTQSSAAAPVHSLLSLPPHIVLEIVSNLYMPDIRSLSLTCTAFRRYLCAESHIWPLMCRSKLTYTPRFLHRHQSAAYYLHVRGNDRLENLVLLQRARVENVIQQIASP